MTVAVLCSCGDMTCAPSWNSCLLQVCVSETVRPVDRKVLEVGCSAHALQTMDTKAAGSLTHPEALPLARKLLQRIERGNKVPSATPALIGMLLDVMRDNKQGYPLPDPDMFKDARGNYEFANRMASYLRRYSCRARANLGAALGGGPATNNAVDRMNRQVHHDFPARRGTMGHIHDLLDGSRNFSLLDDQFDDEMRRDMHHQDMWVATAMAQRLQPYVHFPQVAALLKHCAAHVLFDTELTLTCISTGSGESHGVRFVRASFHRRVGHEQSSVRAW